MDGSKDDNQEMRDALARFHPEPVNEAPDLTSNENDESAEDEAEEEYAPPERLPNPTFQTGSLPIGPLLLALVVSIAVGILLAVSRWIFGFYIYILYNSLVAMAIGWALVKAPRRCRFTNRPVLLLSTLFFSLLAYLTYFVCSFLYVAYKGGNWDALGAMVPLDQAQAFWGFMRTWAEKGSLFGARLGPWGSCVLWSAELSITLFCIWPQIKTARLISLIEMVPVEVLETVLHFQNTGLDRSGVEGELSRRGWTTPDDQALALRATAAYRELTSAHHK